jgi:hypothetical protein
MKNRRTFTLVAGALAALAAAVGCGHTIPPSPNPTTPSFGSKKKPPPPEQQPTFRLTGGGRVDAHDEPSSAHSGSSKSTPETRDFATFGFQARPGSGNITWVEHNPAEPGGGFTFQGPVMDFDEISGDGDCATFSGTGRIRYRDGTTTEVSYTVNHACDVREPRRGADHIMITIGPYDRHGLLSGGTIQSYAL